MLFTNRQADRPLNGGEETEPLVKSGGGNYGEMQLLSFYRHRLLGYEGEPLTGETRSVGVRRRIPVAVVDVDDTRRRRRWLNEQVRCAGATVHAVTTRVERRNRRMLHRLLLLLLDEVGAHRLHCAGLDKGRITGAHNRVGAQIVIQRRRQRLNDGRRQAPASRGRRPAAAFYAEQYRTSAVELVEYFPLSVLRTVITTAAT